MYTDFLGQQISEGDEIVYAQSAYGGGAQLKRAEILKIVPLVPHREKASSYGKPCFMREDQERQAYPTVFQNTLYDDPAKRYVVQIVKEERYGRKDPVTGEAKKKRYTIPHSQHIFRVPA